MQSRSFFRLGLPLALGLALHGCATAPSPSPPSLPAQALELNPDTARNLISAYRQAHGLSRVTLDGNLEKFAQRQADAMASADHLSHEVDGSLSKRLKGADLARATAVENVSAGYHSVEDVFAGWRHSPGHDANLLDPAMRHMGIAAAVAPATHYKTFWALVMTN
ncbi:MAG TPA: CAP domain-containing protein [Beijerinckia sp.]|jgi:uncharacterized protein YkwD|nr:CAP domain-containing protein [Beijerinckia sp.]